MNIDHPTQIKIQEMLSLIIDQINDCGSSVELVAAIDLVVELSQAVGGKAAAVNKMYNRLGYETPSEKQHKEQQNQEWIDRIYYANIAMNSVTIGEVVQEIARQGHSQQSQLQQGTSVSMKDLLNVMNGERVDSNAASGTLNEPMVLSVVIKPIHAPIFAEVATQIEIIDDAGGGYISVSQCNDHIKPGTITIEPEEWPALKAGIDQMVTNCEQYNRNIGS